MKDPLAYFRDITERTAQQSKCRTRAVGAVIVRDDRIIGTGFNSAPMGSKCEDCPRCNAGERHLSRAICAHAEANAIATCARFGVGTAGATLYISCSPCAECAKLIVGAGIASVIAFETYPDKLGTQILVNAGITIGACLL